MFHGFGYPSETGKNKLETRLWNAAMKKGVVEFIRPEECSLRKEIRNMPKIILPSSGAEEELFILGENV
jgi:CRISPR-associated protein Cas5d